MKAFKSGALLSLLVLLPACERQRSQVPATDAAENDSRADVHDGPAAPDVPGVDAPRTDGGAADAPRTDAPAIDAPGIDNAAGDAPRSDAPAVDAPRLDGIVAVGTDAPGSDLRGTDGGGIDLGRPDVADASACRQTTVVLGAAANFAVLAGPTVTNTGPSTVTGDLGTYPGTAVVGFGPGVVVGTQHAGDPTAMAAQGALTTAFNDAAGRVLCPVSVSGNLGGQTLTPGLYKSTSFLEISSGDLTLDAQGDPNAVFIFQMASTLITTTGRLVVLTGLAQASNIFWQVGSSATLGSSSVLQGTIMADQTIILNTGAVLNGRALARIAGVTLDTNTVTKPLP